MSDDGRMPELPAERRLPAERSRSASCLGDALHLPGTRP
jgi:hypothetical protein